MPEDLPFCKEPARLFHAISNYIITRIEERDGGKREREMSPMRERSEIESTVLYASYSSR